MSAERKRKDVKRMNICFKKYDEYEYEKTRACQGTQLTCPRDQSPASRPSTSTSTTHHNGLASSSRYKLAVVR